MSDRRPFLHSGRSWLFAAAVLALALAFLLILADRPHVVFEGEGAFGRVRVTEGSNGMRTLYTGDARARQSVIRPGDPLHLELPYSRVAAIGLAFIPADGRILYVGLGGGAMPMHAHEVLPAATIDVIEIDPLIVDVAHEYFGFRPDSLLRIHTGDGRAFIESAAPATWDLIVLDAFSDDEIPHALATQEFLTAVQSRLKPSGVVLSNLWTANDAYPSMVATYQHVFPGVHLLQVPQRSQVILLATGEDRPLGRDSLVAAARELEGFVPGLTAAISVGYSRADPVDAGVLADSVSRR